MDPIAIVALMIIGLVVLIMIGFPIFSSLGLMSVVGILMLKGPGGLTAIPSNFIDRLDSFTMVAIPLYILMGEMISVFRIGEDGFDVLEKWLGWLPGGLAVSGISACAVFGAMSGVSVAGAAAIGRVTIPEMLKRGYDNALACGSVAAAGGLAVLIPPSIGFIVYGEIADESVAKLFMAGVMPGIALTVLMAMYVIVLVLLRPELAPRAERTYTWSDRLNVLLKIIPTLFIIIMVLGSIYFGIATPTESAAVGALGAIIVGILTHRKQVTLKSVHGIFWETAKMSATMFILFANAVVFGYVLTLLGAPKILTQFVLRLNLSPSAILIAVSLLLIILGCFLDALSIMLITTPLLLPIITAIGFSPLWYGVFLVVAMETAVITPPVGMNLYMIKIVAPEVPLSRIIRGALPFVLVEAVLMVLLVVFPQIALWLPNTMK